MILHEPTPERDAAVAALAAHLGTLPLDEGYCKHGTYVGGIGVDWLCGRCESDYPDDAWANDILRGAEVDVLSDVVTPGIGGVPVFDVPAVDDFLSALRADIASLWDRVERLPAAPVSGGAA